MPPCCWSGRWCRPRAGRLPRVALRNRAARRARTTTTKITGASGATCRRSLNRPFPGGRPRMQRQRPPTLLVMGLACCAFAVAYLLWLLLYRRADLGDLVAAALGNTDVLPGLKARGLARASAVRLTV